MDKVIYVNETMGQIVPSTYPNAVRYVRQEDPADNKFFTGERWVVFDDENLVIDGQSLIDYDTMIKSVPKERLLTIEEWQYINKNYPQRWDEDKKGMWINDAVFLPAAGRRDCDGSVYLEGPDGHYWSSMSSGSERAWYLSFDLCYVRMYCDYRYIGKSVRLVRGVEPDKNPRVMRQQMSKEQAEELRLKVERHNNRRWLGRMRKIKL